MAPTAPERTGSFPLGYGLNQWDALCVYTTDGDLAIDNRAAEYALRRVAIGRKNWLFCGSDMRLPGTYSPRAFATPLTGFMSSESANSKELAAIQI